MLWKRLKQWKWGIFVVGFATAVRTASLLLFWRSLGANREWGFFTMIEHWFQGYGYSFAAETGCVSAYRSPGFLFFLTGVYKFFGFPNFFAQAVVQNLIAVLVVYLVYRLAWRLANDRRIGVIAGVLIALHPYTFYHYTQYYHTVLASVFLVGLLLAYAALERTKRLRWAWVTGALIAASAYVQGTILPAAPLLAFWLLYRWRDEWKRAVVATAIMAFVSAGLIAPWTYRNWKAFDRFVPLTTDLGLALYKANTENYPRLMAAGYPHEALEEEVNPEQPNQVRYYYLPEVREMLERTGGVQDAAYWTMWHPPEPKDVESCSALSPMNEADQNRYWMNLAWKWYSNYPVDGLKLQVAKAITFWTPSLHPSIKYGAPWSFGNSGILAFLARFSLTAYVAVLELLALVGIIMAHRRKKLGVYVPILIVFAVFTFMHTLFAPYTKYRIPLDNFLAVFAAVGAVSFWDLLLNRWCAPDRSNTNSEERIRRVERFHDDRPVADTLVVVPTYNERENITALLDAIAAQNAFDVLVADDNSPDGTAGIVAAHAPTLSCRAYLMRRTGKHGLGVAYLDSFHWVMKEKLGYKNVIQMDADFSHDPAMLPLLAENARAYGVAVGSRYVPGGSTPDWNHWRLLISRVGNVYARWVLRLSAPSYKLRDSTAGFTAYRADVLEKILAWPVFGDGYAYQISMKFIAFKIGFPPLEVPIVFRDRHLGTSKMSGRIVTEAIRVPWRLIACLRKTSV